MTKELKETTKLFQPVFLISFIPVLLLFIVLLGYGIRENDRIIMILCFTIITLNIVVLTLLQIPKLTLVVDQDGIQFKYRPYHRKSIHYAWAEINTIELIKFDPAMEFKGWGRKFSTHYGVGYLTLGGKGIRITDKNDNSVTLTISNVKSAEQLILLYSPF